VAPPATGWRRTSTTIAIPNEGNQGEHLDRGKPEFQLAEYFLAAALTERAGICRSTRLTSEGQ